MWCHGPPIVPGFLSVLVIVCPSLPPILTPFRLGGVALQISTFAQHTCWQSTHLLLIIPIRLVTTAAELWSSLARVAPVVTVCLASNLFLFSLVQTFPDPSLFPLDPVERVYSWVRVSVECKFGHVSDWLCEDRSLGAFPFSGFYGAPVPFTIVYSSWCHLNKLTFIVNIQRPAFESCQSSWHVNGQIEGSVWKPRNNLHKVALLLSLLTVTSIIYVTVNIQIFFRFLCFPSHISDISANQFSLCGTVS